MVGEVRVEGISGEESSIYNSSVLACQLEETRFEFFLGT